MPRVPPKMHGRRWSSRGPSEPISASALRASLLALQKSARPGRAGLLAGLDQDRGVEAQRAALLEHTGQRRDVDGVLALVVGRAAAIHLVAFDHDLPRRQPVPPLVLLAADHVAMAVGQHRRLAVVLDPAGDQERPVFRPRIGQHRAVVAELLQRLGHLARDVLLQRGHRALLLAGGGDGDTALEIVQEAAVVEIFLCARDGAVSGSAHGL